jgi:hypothetical protein
MLDFELAAKTARDQDTKRVAKASSQMTQSQVVIQKQRSFRTQLFAALTKQGTAKGGLTIPDILFVAFPEKLLEKWSYVAYGDQRSGDKDNKEGVHSDVHGFQTEWKQWATLGEKCSFRNLEKGIPRKVLLTHGLSPIEDTTLLLADIGRGVRVSSGMHAKTSVMLADVSWMSHNRSIRKFDLSEEEIANGLRICLDRRRRLYASLRLDHRVHQIVGYEERGEINDEKISSIVARYERLVKLIWGEGVWDTQEPLDNGKLKIMDSPLVRSIANESPLRELQQFPGGLESIERGLKVHLDVMRTLAKRFRFLSGEVISYYFAQYYAQTSYRGTHLKVAVSSERDFDEPFDELDGCFSAWGEGHELVGTGKTTSDNPGLAGFYLPQYRVNKWGSLPYTPLSSDALRRADNKCDVVRSNLPMTTDQDPEKLLRILSETLKDSTIELNRLCYDLLSFISYVQRERGQGLIKDAETVAGCSLKDTLSKLCNSKLVFAYDVESEERKVETDARANLGDLWSAWLDTLSSETPPDYVPSHLLIASLTREDWTPDRLSAAVSVVRLANGINSELIGSDFA